MAISELGKWLKSINVSGDDLMSDGVDERDYERMSFLITRTLSYFPDTILHANEVNTFSRIVPGRMHYRYLLNSIRKKNRFSKWNKKPQEEFVPVLKEYYKCSDTRANQMISLLTKKQLQTIKERLEKGGMVHNNGENVS